MYMFALLIDINFGIVQKHMIEYCTYFLLLYAYFTNVLQLEFFYSFVVLKWISEN